MQEKSELNKAIRNVFNVTKKVSLFFTFYLLLLKLTGQITLSWVMVGSPFLIMLFGWAAIILMLWVVLEIARSIPTSEDK